MGGRLYILSGPSGSGKDTILRNVLKQTDGVSLSVSAITRPMRDPRETEKYRFVTRSEFEDMIARDMLLEYNVYLGEYYGTPKAPVEEMLSEGRDVILEIDVNGAAKVREKRPDAASVFIMPPSFDALRRRLYGRGTEDISRRDERLQLAAGEIARAGEYDYIIINDKLDAACRELQSIILAGRCRAENRIHTVKEFSRCLTPRSDN